MVNTLEFFQLVIGLKWTSGNTLKKKILQFQLVLNTQEKMFC